MEKTEKNKGNMRKQVPVRSIGDLFTRKDKNKDGLMIRSLEWTYAFALEPGVSGLKSADDLAQKYLQGNGSLDQKINDLILAEDAKAGFSGFATGFGGLITLPIMISLNIVSVLFIQVRMIIAIALMAGFDVNDEKIKMLIFACLFDAVEEQGGEEPEEKSGITLENKGTELIAIDLAIELGLTGLDQGVRLGVNEGTRLGLKEGTRLGLKEGTRLGLKEGLKQSVSQGARHGMKFINQDPLKTTQMTVGGNIATQMGNRTAANYSSLIPVLGGIIGGTIDTFFTHHIGKIAKKTFLRKKRD
ncbi:MAG: EcsC family protein [SAR324 cluster bacterium]|nr:EcsC family protein [SAR324 cluster bacterium]